MSTKIEKITRTFKELKEIDVMIGRMYKEDTELRDGKFGYGYKRFAEKNFYPKNKEYFQELSDVRIDNALVDEKTKALLIDSNPLSRGFQYDKEGLKALMKAERVLEDKWDNKVVEIEPYIVKKEDLPKLTEVQKEALKGVLI